MAKISIKKSDLDINIDSVKNKVSGRFGTKNFRVRKTPNTEGIANSSAVDKTTNPFRKFNKVPTTAVVPTINKE